MTEPKTPAIQAIMKVGQNENICWEIKKPAKPKMISLGIGILAFSAAIAKNMAAYP